MNSTKTASETNKEYERIPQLDAKTRIVFPFEAKSLVSLTRRYANETRMNGGDVGIPAAY